MVRTKFIEIDLCVLEGAVCRGVLSGQFEISEINFLQHSVHGTVTPSSVTVLYRERDTNESVRYRRRSTYT